MTEETARDGAALGGTEDPGSRRERRVYAVLAILQLVPIWSVRYLPTTDGYTLLISPADPDGFLAALKA